MREPSGETFLVRLPHLPHGFAPPTHEHTLWFQNMINSDIRSYYRIIRRGTELSTDNPLGRSGITVGELALYVIRQSHCKRQKRY
jgi:hypothetical protein